MLVRKTLLKFLSQAKSYCVCHKYVCGINLSSDFDMQAIKKDHSRIDECFASLLHEHFRSSQDPKLTRLREALKSDPVGKAVFADELEKLIGEGALW